MIKKITPVLATAVLLVPTGAHARTTPAVMAALGDSISAGFNACGWYVACTSRSWSAGDSPSVNSHYLRLLAMGSAIKGHNLNFAVPGATSADLDGQARQAVQAGAGYVTVLIGAQDACVGSEKEMTPVSAFRRNIDQAFDVLRTSGARIYVASIPDVKRLWRVGKDNGWARLFWGIGHICQSMLANPKSTAKKDEARRDRVRERVMDYNEQLRQACESYGPACRYDGGAVFSYPFTLKQVSGWDYFHPNADGQKALAKITFDAGLFSDVEP
ncbi:SGNH/GDSL hydrolase family protein [Microbispora sp. NEAU-D428]|uniref:SGNH/GDSL hydrolase family protein n=1 Tax=Microbispora sitophila TaxID=2771537 RepID=UPI001866FC3D|nr:SGNH/GDSL hydrolase family protein [Microbispora sitophila]MBE3013037.1 SGNH/GDSL hydrolase family protein [Microbispora sitophila]